MSLSGSHVLGLQHGQWSSETRQDPKEEYHIKGDSYGKKMKGGKQHKGKKADRVSFLS